MTKYLLCTLACTLLLTACHKDKKEEPQLPALESVLVYIAGDNNLDEFIHRDMRQMMDGSKGLSKQYNLLLFVDEKDKLPYLMKITNGDTLRLKTYQQEQKSSDAETLAEAVRWMKENYEAPSYGLVLWGHADGWTIRSTTKSGPRLAYGQDTSGGEQWMDIPAMAQALENVLNGQKLRFIFADCCCFQCVESAYELRNVTDYIIASAAEIPGEGAPYQTVIPALFSQRDDFYAQAANAYFEQTSYGYKEPMAVVKTSEMENLAQATRTILAQCFEPQSEDYPYVSGLIYYYDHTMFDMQDFFLHQATAENYAEWKRVFDTAVPMRTMTTVWMANHIMYYPNTEKQFMDFIVTEERYGGVSMYVPQDPSSVNVRYRKSVELQNNNISRMQWYTVAGLDKLGW